MFENYLLNDKKHDNNELNIDIILSKISNILNKTFNIEQKRTIKFYPSKSNIERINFACPICGDSSKSIYKKRGNLYINTMIYKCFNCDTTMNFIRFCERFNEQFDINDKLQIYNFIDNKKINFKSDNNILLKSLNKLIKLNDFVNYINSNTNKLNIPFLDFKPIKKDSIFYKYLVYKRKIFNLNNIYQAQYKVIRNNKVSNFIPIIVFLNTIPIDDELYLVGIQLRNLNQDKNYRFFKIYEFDALYNIMYPNEEIDDIEMIIYNKLSHFFNIFNVDFNKTVYVFEGFLDSLFCNNSIGMVGASNDKNLINMLIDNNIDIDIRFFYDNDDLGYKKSLYMLNKGYSVFLWRKLFKDIIDNSTNKYIVKKELEKIKDLNDLVIYTNNPNVFKDLNLQNYFSIDKFDKIYLNLKEF